MSAGLPLVEAVISVLTWRQADPQSPAMVAIILMKVAFTALVLLAIVEATLPAPAFLAGAVIDALLVVAFTRGLRDVPAATR